MRTPVPSGAGSRCVSASSGSFRRVRPVTNPQIQRYESAARGERESEPTTGTRSSPFRKSRKTVPASPIFATSGSGVSDPFSRFVPSTSSKPLATVAAVQRRSERAQIDQEEPIARRIPADAGVLTRHVGRRGDADVDRIRDAAAPDGEAVLGHVVEMMTGLVVVLDVAQKPRRRAETPGNVDGVFDRWSRAAPIAGSRFGESVRRARDPVSPASAARSRRANPPLSVPHRDPP